MNGAQFRPENQNLSSSADVHVLLTTAKGKKMDKSEKMHVQSVQSYCFCSLNMQICDVLIAVAVVVAKAPFRIQQ